VKKTPQRTCVGCLIKQPKEKLVRLTIDGDQVITDLSGKIPGRGAYLCRTKKGFKKACFRKAVEKKAFERTFKKNLKIKSLLLKYGQEETKKNRQQRKTSISSSSSGHSRPR
jgi:predicted RNA-binding protein YlxR (DUF448 family)